MKGQDRRGLKDDQTGAVFKTAPVSKDLPHGWRWARLADVITEAQSGFASGERDSNGVIQLRMNNVDTRGRLVWNEFIRVPASESIVEKYALRPGDVVFNNTNSTELVGKSAFFDGHAEPVVYSNHFTRLRVAEDQLDSRYLSLWLVEQWQDHVFENLCNRWIGQSAVKSDKLLALEIPVPSLPEQQRIAAILNEQLAAIERARAAAEAQLGAAKALPAAYLREVFESEEARGWERATLGDVATLVQNGIYKSAENYGYGHPFLRMYNVSNDSWELTFEPLARVNLEDRELEAFQLRVGDLLISRVNSFELVGKCGWVGSEAEGCVFENMLIRVRLGKATNSLFVAQQMRTHAIREQIETVAKRAIGQSSINSTDLRGVQIALPPLATQEKIAKTLAEKMTAIGKSRRTLESQYAAIEKLPAALLRRAFAGEL